MIDTTITVGNIIEILTIGIGGLTFLYKVLLKFDAISNNVAVFSSRLDKVDSQMEKVKLAMTKLSDVTAQIATSNGRIDAMETRLTTLSQRIEESHQVVLSRLAELFVQHMSPPQIVQQNNNPPKNKPKSRLGR